MPEDKNVVTFKGQAYSVATQAPGLDDDRLADARRLIGVDYRGARAGVEITHDNIRDFCNYMGSENQRGQKTAHGHATVALPSQGAG